MAQAYKVVRKNKREKENKRSKEVEPNGHVEATRGHELHLQESTSVVPRFVIPLILPTRLGHRGLEMCM